MCRVTNFTAVENAATKGTDAMAYLLPAGANKLLSDNSTTANQCAYSAEANRNAVRGGPWVAITADIPQASIYVSCLLLLQRLQKDLRFVCERDGLARLVTLHRLPGKLVQISLTVEV